MTIDPVSLDSVQGVLAQLAGATCPAATSLPHRLLAVPGFAG